MRIYVVESVLRYCFLKHFKLLDCGQSDVHKDPLLSAEFADTTTGPAEVVVTDLIAQLSSGLQPRFDLFERSWLAFLGWCVHDMDQADKSKWVAQEAIVPCRVISQAPSEARRY